MKQTLIKKLKNFFSHILTLLGLLVLGLILALFFSQRGVQSPTKQGAPATTTELAFQAAQETPTPVVAATITPTATLEVIPVIITTFPTPTPAPSPSPTPTFEPLSDKPIMGFVFEPPQEVPNTRRPDGFDIIQWLPDRSEEVLLRGAYTLETVNILTGMVRLFATVKDPGGIGEQPVWLPEAQGVAYFAWEAGQRKLFLGKEGAKTEILLPDAEPPLIPLGEEKGIATYSKNDKAMRGVLPNKQVAALPAVLSNLPHPSKPGPPGTFHRVAVQPNSDWVAYYNIEGFQLVNIKTDEIQVINLGGSAPAPLWAMEVKWSPDGQKLALIVTQGPPAISFSDLYILEWPTGILHKIDDNFPYITDIAWAPDSKHLLFEAVIDQKDGMDVNALYITDLSTPSIILPVPVPIEGLGSNFGGGLSWSTDGQTVLVKYANDLGVALYKIEVSPQ